MSRTTTASIVSGGLQSFAMSTVLAQGRLPAGTTRVVVLDTNAYRVLAQDRSQADSIANAVELRQGETKHSVFAVASPVVAIELIAHLDDADDPAKDVCMKALASLGEHARNGSGGGVRLFGWTEDLISHALFDASIPKAADIVGNISALVVHIRDNAPSIRDPAAIAGISMWASFVRNTESSWATALARACGVSVSPTEGTVALAKGDATLQKQSRDFFLGQGFQESWSRIEVVSVLGLLGRRLQETELDEAVRQFKNIFAVPLKLQAELLAKLANAKGIALLNPRRKWANHIWDSSISFLVGKGAMIEGSGSNLSPATAHSRMPPTRPAVEIALGHSASILRASASNMA